LKGIHPVYNRPPKKGSTTLDFCAAMFPFWPFPHFSKPPPFLPPKKGVRKTWDKFMWYNDLRDDFSAAENEAWRGENFA
jgi:hypothetical protein